VITKLSNKKITLLPTFIAKLCCLNHFSQYTFWEHSNLGRYVLNIILFQFMLVMFANAQTNIEVSNHLVNIGETFTATINVEPNGASIDLIKFRILYDDALIKLPELLDIQLGSDITGIFNIDSTNLVYFTGDALTKMANR